MEDVFSKSVHFVRTQTKIPLNIIWLRVVGVEGNDRIEDKKRK